MADKAPKEVLQEEQTPNPHLNSRHPGAELTVNDLETPKQIIDVASSVVHLSQTK